MESRRGRIPGVAVKCVEIWRNTGGEGAPGRRLTLRCEKRGEQTGLDALVVHAVNDADLEVVPLGVASGANVLSRPPGEYGRKVKTQWIDGARSGGACGLIRCNAKNLTWS